MVTPTRVALIGALGHGIKHRRAIHLLQAAGQVQLVAVANRRPVTPLPDAPLDGVAVFDDHRRLLRDSEAEVVVVCTPPHTHLAIAYDVIEAGRDLLLEKPPVVSTAEYARLAAAVARAGVACQVNFQSLASPALDHLGSLSGRGEFGTPRSIAVAGCWWRPDGYYQRSPWAGVRSLDGAFVADGALSNQFAHALMQSLALAGRLAGPFDVETVELEWYRSRDIEVEDTACLRCTLTTGIRLVLAVSLASAEFVYGDLEVRGDRTGARLEFPTDRLRMDAEEQWRVLPGRIGLLDNLLAHRRDRGVPLLAPLSSTEPFVRILDVLHAAPAPRPIADRHLRPHPDGDGRVIDGVAAAARWAAADLAMFSELDVAWAAPGHRFSCLR